MRCYYRLADRAYPPCFWFRNHSFLRKLIQAIAIDTASLTLKKRSKMFQKIEDAQFNGAVWAKIPSSLNQAGAQAHPDQTLQCIF